MLDVRLEEMGEQMQNPLANRCVMLRQLLIFWQELG